MPKFGIENQKSNNAGRPKGSVNRKTLYLGKHLETLKIDPAKGLKTCLLKLQKVQPRHTGDEIQLIKIEADLYSYFFQYVYPRVNPIDLQEQSPWHQMSLQEKIRTLEILRVDLQKKQMSEDSVVNGSA